MKKRIRITAFLLSLALLLGILPIAAFSANEPVTEAETIADENVLETLADGKKLYTGPTIGENDTTVYSAETISNVLKSSIYMLSPNPDGSTSLVAKAETAALGETSVAYTTNRNGAAAYKINSRYQVFTTNISRGEDYFNASKHFLRIKLYYEESSGTVASKEMLVFRLDDASKMIQDEPTLTKRVYFGTEAYTNVTVVFDAVNKTYDSYLNGNLVAQNVTLGLSETQELHSIYFFAKHTWGAERFAGVFSRHGRTADFYTDTYPTITAMNGVYEFEGNYYYYESGALLHGTTVEYGGYVLELDANSGRVVNVFKNKTGLSEYKSLSATDIAATLTTAGGDADSVITSTVTTSVTGAIKSYLNTPIKPYAYSDGTLATETSPSLEVLSADYNANTHFTFYTKRVGTNIMYYDSAEDLASGTLTTPATELYYTVRSFNGASVTDDFVIKYPVKFGEGINTVSFENKTADVLNFLAAVMKDAANSTKRSYVIQFKRAEGENTHLILCGVDVGPCEIGSVTDITFKGHFETDENGTKSLYLDVYVNGELKVEDFIVAGAASFSGLQIRDYGGLDWIGEFITFYPSVSYSGNTNVEAITDGYTGIINNGDFSIYYENGAIKERGTYGELNAKYGEESAELVEYNVTLNDVLNLNFYTNLATLTNDEGAYATLTVGDEVQTIYLRDLTAEANGTYKLTAKLSSIEMDVDVELKLFDGEGNPVKLIKGNTESYTYTYSIRRYCEYVIANSSDFTAEAVNAVKALLLYGAAAERNFNGTNGYKITTVLTSYERQSLEYHAIDSSTSLATITNITGFDTDTFVYDNIENIPVNLNGYTSDQALVGDVYLVLDSAIKIRIAINVAETPEVVTGGRVIAKVEGDETKYYVDIEGLTAKDLNTIKVVTVDGVEIGITGLAIASAVINDLGATYDDSFKDLMRALLCYYYYTVQYSESVV